MTAIFVFLFAVYFMISSPVNGYSTNFPSSSEWVPLSKDKVLAHFGASHPQRKQFYNNNWRVSGDFANIHQIRNDAIRLVEPSSSGSSGITNQTLQQIDNKEKSHQTLMICKENGVNCAIEDFEKKPDKEKVASEYKREEIQREVLSRKIRKLFPYSERLSNTDQFQSLVTNENNDIDVEAKKYKVTETNNDIVYDLPEKNNNLGYFYEKPNTTFAEPKQKNQNNLLDDILSKYNIRFDDKLTNYVVSRYRPVKPPKHQEVIFLPIPVNYVTNRSNMIGLLLSNSWFPRILVSNSFYEKLLKNPGEAYKVYPDTDSSN